MGEGFYAGVLRHDTAYGPTLKDVPNPYRFMVVDYGGGGPHQQITPQVEFAAITSWYSTFLYTTTQLGACPEAGALTPQWPGAPGWSSAHKLSGQAAIGWSFKFDRDGKRFANGIPPFGAYGKWAKVYDPRKDSTQPGGSGPHRLGVESTYEWSKVPALHAGTYAYGRYQNGKRVLGVGMPADGIDWAVIGAWANVCEANGWENFFGVVYEPGDRWNNLKEICLAGGGEPVNGGILTFRYSAPTIALDTVTPDDLTDQAGSVTTMPSWRDRINTAIPQYRSPNHNWEIVDADAVVNPTLLAADGEEKREAWPFAMVTSAQQASQLAAYRIFDSRELNPIVLHVKPRLRHYRPGECLQLTIPELGLDTLAIIRRRTIDPTTMAVTLELMGETTAKHAYCLGLTATPPATPALSQTPQQKDETKAAAARSTYNPRGAYNPASSYSINDLVFWSVEDGGDGNSYVRIGEGDTTGVDPTDATKWQLFLEGGVPGADAQAIHLMAVPAQARFDGGDAYVGGAITFTALRSNIPSGAAYLFELYRGTDGSLMYGPGTAAAIVEALPTFFSSSSPEKLTVLPGLVESLIDTYGAFRVVASAPASSATDTVPIVKVKDGANGIPGFSTAPILIYKRSATEPALPSVDAVWTFATKSIAGLNNGWSIERTADDGNPEWASGAIATAQGPSDTIEPEEWAEPVVSVQSGGAGAPGLNSATVTLFKRAPDGDPPPAPDGVVTWTFATGAVTGDLDGWGKEFPATNGQPAWAITAAAVGTGPSDEIGPGQWPVAVKAVEDGAEGAPGVSPVNVTASPASDVVSLQANGLAKSGEIPIVFAIKATKAGAAIAVDDIEIFASTGGTWSVDGSSVRLTALAGGAKAGECVFTVEAGGETLSGNIVSFSTAEDGTASTQISRSHTCTFAEANSASFAQAGPTLAYNAKSDGTLVVNMTGRIQPGTEGYQCTTKLQYSITGGSSWVDVSGSQGDSNVSIDLSAGEPGSPPRFTTCVIYSDGPYALSGLGANATVLLRRMVMKKAGAAATVTTPGGGITLFMDAS